MNLRLGSVCVLPVAALLGCFPPTLTGCEEGGCDSSSEPGTSEDGVPTSSEGVPMSTGSDTGGDASTGATSNVETSGASTTAEPDGPPAIVEREVIPDFTDVNALLVVNVTTEHADGVRMQLDEGAPVELTPIRPDVFVGAIEAFTSLDNGEHIASFTPWRGELVGAPADAEYVIALPPAGFQVAWDAPPMDGHVKALDVLPDGRPVEFGTFQEQGQSRCYLRRREKNGAALDFVPVLPGAHCTAIDMKIDRTTGTIHVLLERNGGNGLRWWAGELAAWGEGAKNIGQGEEGDTVFALASRPGLVAVCGAKAVNSSDETDGLAVLLRPNQPPEYRLFDYQRPGDIKFHKFRETAHDCAFSGQTLVLAGEASGQHEEIPKMRDRVMVVEHNVDTDTNIWSVAGPGPGVQSRALALAVDSEGRYHLVGHTCLDDCVPEGDIRMYGPGGKLLDQVSLGQLGSDWFGPHDISWSPAGYVVIAVGGQESLESVFKVQAFTPGVPGSLWTFTPNDKQGPQMAIAVAIGSLGEVYAGGVTGTNRPAFAVIGG